jgi:hypothetical protein
MPTRNKKSRPTKGKIIVIKGGVETPKEVPLGEQPHGLPMPAFSGRPGILTGSNEPLGLGMLLFTNDAEVRRRAKLHSAEEVAIEGKWDMPACLRTLAKIAHGMMFATYDMGGVRPLLLDIILKGDVDEAWRLVGSAGPIPPPASASTHGRGVHQVRTDVVTMNDGTYRIVVNLRLFAEFGAPEYAIVAGEASINPALRPVDPPKRAKKI